MNTAAGPAPQIVPLGESPAPRYVSAGATQKMSDHVNKPLFPSCVFAATVPPSVNEESFRIPQDARIAVLKGTGTLWVTSMTESIAPPVPQNTSKSAARVTVDVSASMFRCGRLGTVW